jgi:hypothetical protein
MTSLPHLYPSQKQGVLSWESEMTTGKSESLGVDQEGSTASSRAETPCTCGVGTMFFAHLHEGYCACSKGVRAPLKIQYETVSVEDVVRYFVKGYQGGPPEDFDWYLDATKGVVVLKLYIR